jgi:hypothetical protein
MIDRTLARGLFLAAIAAFFGIGASRYNIGTLGRAGPGLFPLIVSGLLGLVALATLVRSRFEAREPLDFNVRNIALLLTALSAFALTSKFLNMTAGIVVMVFIAGVAGKASYSMARNIKISLGLLAVALAFHKLLGLNLNLY